MLDARPLTCSSAGEDEVVVPPQTPPREHGSLPPPPEKAQECMGTGPRAKEKVDDKQEEENDKKIGGEGASGLSADWFGCSFCENRWFEKMSLLESHYGKEHEGATSYQFELLELKKCVIVLPHMKKVVENIGAPPATGEDLNKQFSKLTLSGRGGGGQGVGRGKGMKNKRLVMPSIGKAIRKAIKMTEGEGEWKGSSYRRIKEYLINKLGMEADKLKRKLRRVLERFVEMGKLERRFSSGKTIYSINPSGQGDKEEEARKEAIRLPKIEERRRFRDQQLKQLAKNLRPHDLRDHE